MNIDPPPSKTVTFMPIWIRWLYNLYRYVLDLYALIVGLQSAVDDLTNVFIAPASEKWS